MPGKPATRILDSTSHGSPLAPGTGSPNVLIGKLPAFRGLPVGAGAAITTAVQAGQTAMRAAEAATVAAAPTPGAGAAKLAEETLKTSLAASMGSMMSAAGAMTDKMICPLPVPIPPHGIGLVVNASMTVMVNNLPLARMGDQVMEALGGPNPIVKGEFTVLVGG